MISNMTADVSSLVRLLNGYKDDRKDTTLTTRDLLGNGDRSLELDLDLQVPSGYEKRLDLKSGKVYLQRCNSPNQTVPTVQDLNFPPVTQTVTKPLLNLFDDTTRTSVLSENPVLSPCSNFESVCTLDKVKSALERAERDPTVKKRQSPEETFAVAGAGASPVAAGCPGCLSYVLVMKNNPKCPRCDTIVPLALEMKKKKKQRIDLNISI